MDGADYAAHPPDDGWLDEREEERRRADQTMDRIANTLIDVAQTEGLPDETHA